MIRSASIAVVIVVMGPPVARATVAGWRSGVRPRRPRGRRRLRMGRLVPVLEAYAAPPLGIYALYPQRRQLPLRLRLFIDCLREAYAAPEYWG